MSSVEVFRVCLVRGLRVKCGEDNGISRQVTADYNNICKSCQVDLDLHPHFSGIAPDVIPYLEFLNN